MARCNHLLALPFPAAALLVNAASAHSLANSAFCFYRNHPQPSSHHLRISSLSYSALRQHGAYHFRLEKKNCATAWKAQYRRNSPTAATGGLDGGIGDCDDVSIRVGRQASASFCDNNLPTQSSVFCFANPNRLCHQSETPCDLTSFSNILRGRYRPLIPSTAITQKREAAMTYPLSF
jgi:hypothetical protein